MEMLLVIAMVVGIAALIIVLKVPAFAVLFSLLVGQVLSMQASTDVYSWFAQFSGIANYQYVQAGLLLVPFILTMVFLKNRTEISRLHFELLPALFAGATLLVLLYPFVNIIKSLLDAATNDQIDGYRSTSLIIAAVLGLVSVWISLPKEHHAKHKEKHAK